MSTAGAFFSSFFHLNVTQGWVLDSASHGTFSFILIINKGSLQSVAHLSFLLDCVRSFLFHRTLRVTSSNRRHISHEKNAAIQDTRSDHPDVFRHGLRARGSFGCTKA